MFLNKNDVTITSLTSYGKSVIEVCIFMKCEHDITMNMLMIFDPSNADDAMVRGYVKLVMITAAAANGTVRIQRTSRKWTAIEVAPDQKP